MKNKKILGIIFLILAVFSLGSCSLIDALEDFIAEKEQELGITNTPPPVVETTEIPEPTPPPVVETTEIPEPTPPPVVETTEVPVINEHLTLTQDWTFIYRSVNDPTNPRHIISRERILEYVRYDDMSYEEATEAGIVIEISGYDEYERVYMTEYDKNFEFAMEIKIYCGQESVNFYIYTIKDPNPYYGEED